MPRSALRQLSNESNTVDSALNFSFEQRQTQKKPWKQSFNTKMSKSKKQKNGNEVRSKQKQNQIFHMLIGELKEHNHQKMLEMFNQLRRQIKQKQEKNILLQKQVQELNQELKQTKLQYGRSLRSQQKLSSEMAQLKQSYNKLESDLPLNEQILKTNKSLKQELDYYKSQLYQTQQQMSELKKQYSKGQQEQQRQFRLKDLQWKYQMRLDEAQSHIKQTQRQNWELTQLKIANQTQIKKLSLQIQMLSSKLNTSFSNHALQSSISKNNHPKDEELQYFQEQVQNLQKHLSWQQEQFQLQLVQLQSQLELQQFKSDTYKQHITSLETKINSFNHEHQQLKQQYLQLLENHQKVNDAKIAYQLLLQQTKKKLQSSQQLKDYHEIFKLKLNRLLQNKTVAFFNENTQNFVSLTHRSSTRSIHENQNTFRSNTHYNSYTKHSNLNNSNCDKKGDHEPIVNVSQPYSSIRSQRKCQSMSENTKYINAQEYNTKINSYASQFPSKILQQRKEIQNRIRLKYSSKNLQKDDYDSQKQALSQLSKPNIPVNKQSSFIKSTEKAPVNKFSKHKEKLSHNFYITSQFDEQQQ